MLCLEIQISDGPVRELSLGGEVGKQREQEIGQ